MPCEPVHTELGFEGAVRRGHGPGLLGAVEVAVAYMHCPAPACCWRDRQRLLMPYQQPHWATIMVVEGSRGVSPGDYPAIRVVELSKSDLAYYRSLLPC
jgi:hypothetical protein